jgi:hypothetical protein
MCAPTNSELKINGELTMMRVMMQATMLVQTMMQATSDGGVRDNGSIGAKKWNTKFATHFSFYHFFGCFFCFFMALLFLTSLYTLSTNLSSLIMFVAKTK